jgi:hypothetical protein
MAEGERSSENEQKYFDRYEVVAVALPGAAFLLFLYYLRPQLFGVGALTIKDITLGALGIFAISAMVAGQLLQGFVNVAELILNPIGDWLRPSPIVTMPEHERIQIIAALASQEIQDPGTRSRRRFRQEMHDSILSAARRGNSSRFSDVYNTTYGLNRGLAMASALTAVIAAFDQKWWPMCILILVFFSTLLRAIRASRRFERDMLRTFANLA